MKQIPNLLSVARIFFAILLLFTEPLSRSFLFSYSLCGISDMLDGPIARKYNWSSSLGIWLDSLADLIFFAAASTTLIPILFLPAWFFWCLGAILLIRCVSYIIGACRFRQFASLHTWSNKLTGLLLFLFPFFFSPRWLVLVFLVALWASFEELLIVFLTTDLNKNIGSLASLKHKCKH
ncbi:CDP-alcohol phosphatidyltransferase [Enterococcus florum]|uniref:CDP-alcohol phosphatidyltransferase n=1 Tax=Enterococcus florum TaxID=2480627 RepID=A0A4P5PC45_9ENTE|nr:CDP-alcohol phosphatidyltransferase family protein [Enterococcus florum]GCF94054.1 CDP-alcohol phosphatidyltransferase [Enterococcus florum]